MTITNKIEVIKEKKTNKEKFHEAYLEIMSTFGEKDYIDLIKVVWVDAHSVIDTVSLKDLRQIKLGNVISIGYLIAEDEDSIKICSFIFPDEEHNIQDPSGITGFRNAQIIPKKMIKSILSFKVDFEDSKKWRDKFKEKEK